LAWKQRVLIVPYGAEFDVLKFLSEDILQNLMQEQHKISLLLNIEHFNTQSNVSSIKSVNISVFVIR